MSPLLKRIAREHRSLVLPIAIGLAVNIALFAFVVYPLGVRSADAANRADRAANARAAAERDLAAAEALVAGKARADEELNAFYKKVLPADLVAAQRMTYGPLPALASRANVLYERRSYSPEVVRDALMTRLSTTATFEGDYEDLRDFIYELESAPEFVIIDAITLTETGDSDRLTLQLALSTFFRTGSDVP